MKHYFLILTLSICILSCGQSDTKQKELELKERELALKEKEFALKQKDSSNYQINPATTVPVTDNPNSPHSDFKVFWEDFKKAINAGDVDAVAKMTNIPFKDKYREEFYKYMPEIGRPLTSNSVAEFKANYNKIFSSEVVKLINSNGYRMPGKPKDEYNDYIKKGEYCLRSDPGKIYELVFAKTGNSYMLAYISYYINPDEGG